MAAKILVVDDNTDLLDSVELLLHLHQYEVITSNSAKDALLAVTHQPISLVIQDMNFAPDITSGNEGRDLFHQIRTLRPNMPIILMTAWTQLETAVDLVKAGAIDYLSKPWNDERLLETVAKYCSTSSSSNTHGTFLFASAVMSDLVAQAKKVAQSNVNVLITGPNGSGKEALADYIHQYSTRASKLFLKVNIGALPESLMEAELFGAEKGAFTGANSQRIGRFEEANQGTLFLDEIGHLSLLGQAKLLRVLQTGEFERLGSNKTIHTDVRIVCATNAHLATMVQQGTFREDLWFRLNVIELSVPPLSARLDDISVLVPSFLSGEYTLSEQALQKLHSYHWPGNVRELQNACLRATVFAADHTLQADDFLLDVNEPSKFDEREQIVDALNQSNWVIKSAAESLGLSRQSLYRRMDKHNIVPPL